ncbi:MAG: hypothetical protein AB7K09_10105 [Planctomycetota bacterium]
MQLAQSRASRGTVLIIVLGVLTILSVMGTAFSRFMRTELQASKYFELRKKAEQLAHDGITFATARLANIAAERHYTSLKNADWAYECNAVTGALNYVPGNPPKGFGVTRLEDSESVSFALPGAEVPAGMTPGTISVVRPRDTSTLISDGDVIRLKVIECQSQVNIRYLCHSTFGTFRDTLWDLGVAISRRYAGDWFSANPFLQDSEHVVNGEQVITSLWAEIDSDAQINPPGNQSFADREFGTKEEFLDALRNVHTNLNMPDTLWELAQDYITATNWPVTDGFSNAPNQVREARDPDGDGKEEDYYWMRDGLQNDPVRFPGLKEMYNLQRVSMPPINVNTASREVLLVLFNRLQGERAYEDRQGLAWANDFGMQDVFRIDASTHGGGLDYGQHRGEKLDLDDAVNDATLKFVQIGPFTADTGTPLPHSNDILVDILMREREVRPFTSWHDFDMRFISRLDAPQNGGFTDQRFGLHEGLAALPHPRIPFNDGAPVNNGALGLIGLLVGGELKPNTFTTPDWDTWWYESCRELLRAALQPAPKVTSFNPDEAYWQPIDALDVQYRTAPVCFHSFGLYEITSLAQINGPTFNPQTGVYDNAPVSSSKVRAVVKVMDLLRHHTQKDFVSGIAASGTLPPDIGRRSVVDLTGSGTASYPNSVDESASIGLHQYSMGWNWNRIGAGTPPNEEFGYVQIRPTDHSPYELEYMSDINGWSPQWGGTPRSTFIHKFNACGIDPNFQPSVTWSPNHLRDYEMIRETNGVPLRARTANNQPVFNGRFGVSAFSDCMTDGIFQSGRGRDPDDEKYGGQWAPRYWRYPAGDDEPDKPYSGDEQESGNVPYYRGTVEFWCKFKDDWWGTTNPVRATNIGLKQVGHRNDAQRNAFHADNWFCGLFGCTTMLKRDKDHIVGQQMFIYKDVGMQLKIVRLLFSQAFQAELGPNGVPTGSIENLGDSAAEMEDDNWDVFERDAGGVAANDKDLGPLFARLDCIVFLDSLPFPILPHHWYHFSVAWDSNDDPNNAHAVGEYQSEPFAVAINGFQCRYAQELVIPDGQLTVGTNDGHTFFQGAQAKIARSSVILNELNPEDRMTIGCIERLMLPQSHYDKLGMQPQLFQFANHDPNLDKDRPFRLVAPANATIDTVRITTRKVTANYYNYATGEPTGVQAFRHARFVQPVYKQHASSASAALANAALDPAYPNRTMSDGPGYYYENGWVNTYAAAIRPAWIAWTEYRPRWDPTRHLGPPQAGNKPHATLGGVAVPGVDTWQPPRSNISPFEADYVHMFAAIGKRQLGAWSTASPASKLDSEQFHSKPEFTNDKNVRPGFAAPSLRQDRRGFDPAKKIFAPASADDDNLTWYGGMTWPTTVAGKPVVVQPNELILYRAYFRRGEATIARPHMTSAVLDEVIVGLATPPRFLEYTVLD